MLDVYSLSTYFEPIIEANSNPFTIKSERLYKEYGELKTTYTEEVVDLHEYKESVFIDIINVSEIEEIDYYSKNIFQKIFKNKTKYFKKFLETQSYDFIITSSQTSQNLGDFILKSEIEEIPENYLIFGFRDKLVYRNDEVGYDTSNFKVYKLI